ncbi:MAG: 2-C-methyl-D-erythritol 4-phosphate cytidylyltransferase [Gammaproteobacteria bacterium]
MACCAVIAAAGTGARAGGAKQFTELNGRAALWHAVRPFVRAAAIDRVRVVVAADASEIAARSLGELAAEVELIPQGGATRTESVRAGLAGLADDDWAAVHDGARPCLGDAALARLLSAAFADDVGALLALPLCDALKCESGGRAQKTDGRGGKFLAQTPQMFRAGMLRAALCGDFADEAEAVENAGYAPLLAAGEAANIKITYPGDFALAEAILAARA